MRQFRTGDDAGAVLIMALVFMTAISFVMLGILSFTSTSFRSSSQLKQLRVARYTADGAAETLLQTVRANTTFAASGNPAGDCGATPATLSQGAASITVTAYCTKLTSPIHPVLNQREVLITAACISPASLCGGMRTQNVNGSSRAVLLRAHVTIQDFTISSGQIVLAPGAAVAINDWNVVYGQ
jgi:Tfp pilus assembly protein PilX